MDVGFFLAVMSSLLGLFGAVMILLGANEAVTDTGVAVIRNRMGQVSIAIYDDGPPGHG